MPKVNRSEIFPIVDTDGRTIGRATRGECHSGSKLLHPVVHLQLFNSRGELYLQKRSLAKDIQPGKWDTAVGGHVDYGETIEDALRREACEELGINDFHPRLIERYVFESTVEKELVCTYTAVYDGEITPDPDEIACGRFWPLQEIEAALGTDTFTPNFEREYIAYLRGKI